MNRVVPYQVLHKAVVLVSTIHDLGITKFQMKTENQLNLHITSNNDLQRFSVIRVKVLLDNTTPLIKDAINST